MPFPVVGLIGCGRIGQFHSRNIRGALRSELVSGDYVAVCDRILDRAQGFATITGARIVVPSAEELFETPGLNAVHICTETAEHPELVIEAARRGLNVFCEKPLAKSVTDVDRMLEAVSTAGVVHQVGLILRHSPVFTVMHDLMQESGLGPFLTAHLRDDQFFPVRGHYGSTWRGSFERAGGGTLIEHSIHDIDLFRWLFGEILAVRCHTRVTSGHDRVEDVALCTFQHADGHQTTLSSIWHDIDDRPSTRRLEVFFEGAHFATDHDFIGPIWIQRRTGPAIEMAAEEVLQRYAELIGVEARSPEFELIRRGMWEDYLFLKCVTEDRPAFPDFTVAAAAHRVVDACYRSAAEHREVELPR